MTSLEQFARRDGRMARQYEYDDGVVIAVDFDEFATDASVDVIGGTVIVVLGNDQYEFDLPGDASDAQAFIKNGVLSIELEESE